MSTSTNGDDEELKTLRSVMKTVKAQIKAFQIFNGENAQMDMLLQNVNLILRKQNCSSLSLCDCQCRCDRDRERDRHRRSRHPLEGSNNGPGSGHPVPVPDPSDFSESQSIRRSPLPGQEPVSVPGQGPGSEHGAGHGHPGQGHVPTSHMNDGNQSHNHGSELERLRIGLTEIKNQISAFRYFSSESSNLHLLIQNLDKIINKFPVACSSSSSNSSTSGASSSSNSTSASGSTHKTSSTVDVDLMSASLRDELSEDSCSSLASGVQTDNVNTSADVTEILASTSAQLDLLSSTDHPLPPGGCSHPKRRSSSSTIDGVGASSSKKPRQIYKFSLFELEKPVTPEEKVFATDLAVIRIFKSLNTSSLCTCREINWRFNSYASQALRRRDCLRVHFKYDWSIRCYISSKYKPGLSPDKFEYSLRHFTNFLTYCDDFICESFIFSGGTLISDDLQEFLDFHGKKMKKLQIDLFAPPPNFIFVDGIANDTPTIYSLRKLLVVQAPLVDSLELGKFPLQWQTGFDRLFPEPKGKEIVLKGLKFLKLRNDPPSKIAIDLLTAGINLQEVSSYPILPLCKANKFHLMKTLIWLPSPDDIDHHQTILSNVKSTLQVFGLSLEQIPANPDQVFLSRLSEVTSKLLEYSSKTLLKLLIASPLGFLGPSLRIPPLPQVQSLMIRYQRRTFPGLPEPPAPHGKTIFPRGFNLKGTFPNLKRIIVSIAIVPKTEAWENFFENFEPVMSVKCLEILDTFVYLPQGWMERFAILFPKVEMMKIDTKFFDFPDAVKGLWKFMGLKELKVKINTIAVENSYPAVDSAFTGFSHETCFNLHEFSNTVDIATVDSLREGPSIAGLKELKTLRLTFFDPTPTVRMDYPTIITHVTGLFAFQMCPQLQVFVEVQAANGANARRLVNSLSPIFSSVHSHAVIV